MITGASSGLGFSLAKQAAAMGAQVILVCRTLEKGQTAIAEIKRQMPGATLSAVACDLSSIESVLNFAESFHQTHQCLDILVNNAGVLKIKRTLSKDGFELMFQTNYLSPFILSNSLLDLLKKSPDGQIINIAGAIHQSINFEDLPTGLNYQSMNDFMRSKLCLLLYTFELAKRTQGTGIRVNATEPGAFKSKLSRDVALVGFLLSLFAPSADQAATKIWNACAVMESQNLTGGLVLNGKIQSMTDDWNNQEINQQLWRLSDDLLEKFIKKDR